METGVLTGGEYSYLIPRLLSEKGSGHVHSIFSNGFNISMKDSLVFIGNKKNGLLPFGIHIQEDIGKIVTLVNNREPVRWNNETSSLEFSKLTICLDEGKSFHNRMSFLKSNSDLQFGFDRLLSLLTSIPQPTGLDIDIKNFLYRFNIGQKQWTETEKYLIRLIDVSMSSDLYFIEKTLRYLIGRGKGLTPSGDDLLVGFLAFDSIANIISSHFYNQLSDLLENGLLTTDVSREYLRYALRHEFSSTVTDVVNALSSGSDHFKEVFESLLKVGHSSGLDTLFGILIGMLAFKSPNEQ